jgi:hypothetical protein
MKSLHRLQAKICGQYSLDSYRSAFTSSRNRNFTTFLEKAVCIDHLIFLGQLLNKWAFTTKRESQKLLVGNVLDMEDRESNEDN